MNNDNMNNNINEYRENIMPDTSAFDINYYPSADVPNGMVNGGANMGFDTGSNVEEFVSVEFVNSYLNATNQNTPDLWSRIEAGFEEEAKDVVAEQRRKSARTKKTVGFVAAAVLITIVAVPVMMSGMFGAEEESTRVYDMTTESATVAEEGIHYDESSDSVAMEAPSEGAMESIEDEVLVESATEAGMESDGVMDSTEASPPATDNSNSITIDQGITNNETETQLKEIRGVQTDDRQVVVVVAFIFDGSDKVTVEIKEIKTNQYLEFDIHEGDKITLSNPMYVSTLSAIIYEAEITLDSINIDESGDIIGRIIELSHLW